MPTKSVAPKKRAAVKVAPPPAAAPVARVLVLRSIAADLRSGREYVEGGFAHPAEVGKWVEAPDWDPTPGRDCGGGIHGLLWGEGDAGLAAEGDGVRWQVYAVDPAEGLVSHPAKCRFRRGELVYLGDRDGATAYVLANGGHGRAVIYGTATAGYGGTATAGYGGTATAGNRGTATAGNRGTATAGYGGTATAGNRGTATAGYGGTATAGYGGTATAGDVGTATAGDSGTATAGYGGTATAGNRGTATAGDSGTATAGDVGTATAGDSGTATAGDGGTATAGDSGIVVVKWWDGKRYREAIGYTGEDGIKVGAAYRVVNGKLAEVTP